MRYKNVSAEPGYSEVTIQSTLDLICPCPAFFLDPPFPWRRNPAASARASTGCRHCWLRPPMLPVTGSQIFAVLQQQTLLLGFRQGSWQHRGVSTSFVTSIHGRQGKKNTKNHLGCLAFPTVRLCLVVFLNLPALTIQSGIFQAWCLLKVLEKVSQRFNCFWKENNQPSWKKLWQFLWAALAPPSFGAFTWNLSGGGLPIWDIPRKKSLKICGLQWSGETYYSL